MKKKNGFIAISIIYSFFLCFTMLMVGMIANYASAKFLLEKINTPLNIKIGEEEKFIENIDFVDVKPRPERPCLTLAEKIKADNHIKDEEWDGQKVIKFSIGAPCRGPNCGAGITCSYWLGNPCGLFKRIENGKEYLYFRGGVNNYVKFAGMLWNVIRINEDGSIRLILSADTSDSSVPWSVFNNNVNDIKYSGFTYDNEKICTNEHPCEVTYNNGTFSNSSFRGKNSTIKTELENWFITKFTNDSDKNYIVDGIFCNDVSYSYSRYGQLNPSSYIRIFQDASPQISCPDPKDPNGNFKNYGGVYKTKIGLITQDEANMGGLSAQSWDPNGTNIYVTKNPNYLYGYRTRDAWTMTGSNYNDYSHKAYGYAIFPANVGFDTVVSDKSQFFPVINISSDYPYTSGNGTISQPYKAYYSFDDLKK